VAAVVLLAAAALTGGLHAWAGYHLRAARSCVALGHNALAHEHLRVCLWAWPRDPECLLLAARTARRLGELDRAGDYLEQYQRLRGRDDTDLFLEQVLLHVERGEMDRYRDFCRSLVAEAGGPGGGSGGGPGVPPGGPSLALEAMTRACLRSFRYGEAREVLARWLGREPDSAQALFYRAYLHDQGQEMREAAADYRRALERDPDHEEARQRLVTVLLHLHKASEALPHVEHLRRRRPDDPPLQVLLARCRDQLGQREEAEALLDAVLARQPKHPAALVERGQLALRAGQSEAAEDWLREAVALEPGDYQAHYQLYLCLKRNGKADEAAEVDRRLGEIRADMERIQEIVGHEMQERPHAAALHYEVGLIALRAGAWEEGRRWLESALREDPRYAPAHRALAAYYQRTGDPGLAARHRQQAGPAGP
jgi:tetratricopeptide (TPR) repeat protein